MYKVGQELYYVNPFSFDIEKVIIEFVDESSSNCYIDNSGAYLEGKDLYIILAEAKAECFRKLNSFYSIKLQDIIQYKGE